MRHLLCPLAASIVALITAPACTFPPGVLAPAPRSALAPEADELPPLTATQRAESNAGTSDVSVTEQRPPEGESPLADRFLPPVPPPTPPEIRAHHLRKVFERHRASIGRLSYAQLKARHRPDYVRRHGIAVSKARFYESFVDTFELSRAERTVLSREGFVVVPAPREHLGDLLGGAGPADVFYRVFAADLPVFVSADAILHAWHRSYDKLLEITEEEHLSYALAALLDGVAAALEPGREDERDALLFVSIARTLLDRSAGLGVVAEDALPLIAAIDSAVPAEVTFLGQPETMDFSQYIPRGHYTRSDVLSRYFQSMMWLSRSGLTLYSPDRETIPNPRAEAAARALARTLRDENGSLAPLYRELDVFYSRAAGQQNSFGPFDLLDLCRGAGQPNCEGEGSIMVPVYASADAPAYSGRLRSIDQRTLSMSFLPQRFGYDAWVTALTTAPELEPNQEGGRTMASPHDVAFVLGSDRALDFMAEEMQQPHRQHLPATLEALRRTYDEVAPSQLGDSVYNNWLEALMALSEPPVSSALPRVMRTRRWHDRRLEAVLGSWTELRHDSILLIAQGYGSIGCQYPEGYVEPVPELYRALARSAASMRPFFELRQSDVLPTVAFFDHFAQTMERLARLAELELAGGDMSEDDLAFLNHTVDTHSEDEYDGTRRYDGWYPRLFWWNHHHSGVSVPVVSDVHTDAMTGSVLQVGVSYPDLLIVAIESEGGAALYGGPATSFYSFRSPIEERMTDEEWRDRLNEADPPPRPDFTTTYRGR